MTTWRVLTWNIIGSRQPNLDVITEVISGYAADVVALQEVRQRQARGLARRLGWPSRATATDFGWSTRISRRTTPTSESPRPVGSLR